MVFLGFGSDAYYGVRFTVGAKIMEMKGYVKVEPYGGVSAYGELGIGFLLYGKLKLVGQIMDTGFPTTAEVTFSKFPLDVKYVMVYVSKINFLFENSASFQKCITYL